MSWALTGSAVVGGAAGYGMYRATKPTRHNLNFQDYTPYSTQKEVVTGQALEDRIMAAMGGSPDLIGYPKDFVSRQTSPFVQQLRSDFPDVQKATTEAFGASGLGRSTFLPQQLGEQRTQHGRDINQLVSQAELQSLQQKKLDQSRYEQLAQGYTDRELQAQNNWSQFMTGGEMTNIGLNQQYEQGRQQQLTGAIGTGLSTAGNVYGALAPSPSFGAGGAGSDVSGMSLSDLLSKAEANKRARPYTGGAGRSY